MKKIIKHIYNESNIGYYLIEPFLKTYYFLKYRTSSDKAFLKKQFKNNFGYPINLDHPKTLNEKILWLKLNDRTRLHTISADKFAVRDYIKEKIGNEYLIPISFMTKNVNDITPMNLPDYPCIIKTNHDSGGGIFVRDKKKLNYTETKKLLKRRLSRNYYYAKKEWQYKDIEPCIIVEKLLTTPDGCIPADYKFHCFNGKLAYIQVDLDRATDHKRNHYDPDWNFLDFKWIYENGNQVERPESLEKMKALSEKIAEDFIYVRVDLYTIDSKIYFGELTFHSESGLGKFTPEVWDKKLGEKLALPL
ncbi:TupA-like ATPgrasp [Arenibacter nanhaiticus]|uniref:TupA-like ATPgrasp n=1 Tax=Arenibacter nanhaiticus TaxID=558155 RepID=A0A1M6KLD0_9FLAO|nr:ATP-grasp fold amidoligase family protein [Arenibacter nanhaiticus]SHJ59661.1 TupA-like ATPgrasp [Arenibacter nanhaiticus]